jgi:hypothetical protein
VQRSLAIRSANLKRVPRPQQVRIARSRWHGAVELRADLVVALDSMAHGRRCCNYCSDCLGTDVDHYCPISQAPLSTFDWTNHLLACSRCNSHAKRSLFPRDEYGNPLIIDPTIDDPWEHIRLAPSTGEYVAVTPKGQTTIELLLDTDLLARGRRAAWLDVTELIIGHYKAVLSANSRRALMYQYRLMQRPNLDAFYAMLRWSEIPTASLLFEAGCLTAITEMPTLYRSWLSLDFH